VFEARFADGAASLIVKVYAAEWRWKQSKELHVYRLLAGVADERVPQIVGHEDADNPTGHSYTVMTCLPGRPLSEVSAGLGSVELADLYTQIGEFAAAVHSVGQPAFGYLVEDIVDPEPTNRAYMERQFAKKLCEYEQLGGDPSLVPKIRATVSAAADNFAQRQSAALCHHDLHEGNILVEEDGGRWLLRGVVDVENAIAADPLLDLAKTFAYSIRGQTAKLEGLTAGHPGVTPGWHESTLVRAYRLYHALELWDWFASIGNVDPLASIRRDMAAVAA
jgi:aminoglycoside phosphotransferase (APT) family kinase protein